jgi:2,3-dihydroxybenzoate decarboxylase
MRYIALEEAFSIPELADRQAPPWPANRFSQRHLADWARKLPDFTEYRLPEMDAAGIDVQVLSLTVPGLQTGVDAATARDDARIANDYLARVVAGHPHRFRGFAALPMQDPAAAADELRRCVRDLGFCGALVNDHFEGHYLDEPRFDEVWAALEELSVPLYLHPGAPPADHWKVLDGRSELYGATWSWAAETGGHALRIIYGAVFDRHPGATLILGHMGEFLPFMRSRMDSRYATIEPANPLRRTPTCTTPQCDHAAGRNRVPLTWPARSGEQARPTTQVAGQTPSPGDQKVRGSGIGEATPILTITGFL